MCKKDYLFKNKSVSHFQFDNEVTSVFEDMLNRSIPHYSEVLQMTCDLIYQYSSKNGHIVELGSSTGNLFYHLSQLFPNETYKMTGYDNSLPMIEKSKSKLKNYPSISFIHEDVCDFSQNNLSFIVSNYTIQFIPINQRLPLLKKIYQSLKEKGIFIWSEKIKSSKNTLDETFFYHQFKKRNGYSLKEIERKQEALKNILLPLSLEDNKDLLKKSGFHSPSIIFKWYNFVTFFSQKL